MVTLINPGTTPQVYTTDGRMLPAGERLENVTLDDVGQAAVDTGRLRVAAPEPAVTEDRGEGDDLPESADALLAAEDAESTRPSARRTRNTSS